MKKKVRKTVMCGVCEAKFASEGELTVHIQEEHVEAPRERSIKYD